MATIRFGNLLVISFFLSFLTACHEPPPKPDSAAVVMVTQPKATTENLHSYAGEIQAQQQTDLAFRVTGQIVERYVDVGDQIKVGQVLAKLDVKDAVLQLNTAQAQLEQAQANYQNTQIEYRRFQQLLPEHAISQSQFDTAENQYKVASSSLKQAQANYAIAKNQTQYNQLIANKNGIITNRLIEVGQVISAGQTAYQMALNQHRDVVIGVPEQLINKIKLNQPVSIILWSDPTQRYAGVVREISPSADQGRIFTVKVAFNDNNPQIQLGQSARVFFNTEQNASLSVPLTSVSAIGNQAYVWTVNQQNQLQRTWVKLGQYQRDSATIISGLTADQWIVIGGVHLLRDQQKVQPVDHLNRSIDLTKIDHVDDANKNQGE